MTTNEESAGLDPTFFFNPFDPAFIADPYPTYAMLRAKAPVYAWPLGGSFLLSRFEDVAAALRDGRLSTNPADWEASPPPPPEAQMPEFQRLMSKGLFVARGNDHARLRRLVGPSFTARAVEAWRQDIEQIVQEAIDSHATSGVVDLAQVADFIPLRVISRILGIPKQLDPDFRRFGSAILQVFDPLRPPDEVARLMEPIAVGTTLLRSVVAERRGALGDDLMSSLIRAEEAGDRLSEDELIALIGGLIIGGAETAVHFILFGARTLLRHPAQLAQIRAEPALLKGALEEILRFDSFVKTGIPRYALEDIEIRGVPIAKGKMIIPLTSSASHDADVFQDPDTFNIQRGAFEHLTFGAGPHLCLGASLARLEVEIALSALLRRFPEMTLAGEPVFGVHPFLRPILSLRVDVGASAPR